MRRHRAHGGAFPRPGLCAAPSRYLCDRHHARRACRRFVIAASGGMCLPGQVMSCIPTRCMTAAPAAMTVSATGSPMSTRRSIQQALGGKPLPFVADPVLDATSLPAEFRPDGVGYRRRHRRCRAHRDRRHGGGHARRGIERRAAVRLASPGVAERGCAMRSPRSRRSDIRWASSKGWRPRPLDACPAIPGGLRNQPRALPYDAAARSRAPAAERRDVARRSCGRCGLCRSEPHVPALQARLRPDAGEVGSAVRLNAARLTH